MARTTARRWPDLLPLSALLLMVLGCSGTGLGLLDSGLPLDPIPDGGRYQGPKTDNAVNTNTQPKRLPKSKRIHTRRLKQIAHKTGGAAL